jgi:sugar phosphate isomerase/epimerase
VRSIVCDPFFDIIEVTRVNDVAQRAKVRGLIEESGVEAAFGAQPILLGEKLDLNHPDESERRRAVDAVKNGIDQAQELGCFGAAVLSGPISSDREAAKARLVDSLKELNAYAQPKGLPVALETFDQRDFGKNCLIGPTQEAVEISQHVRQDFPGFGLMLDLSHLPLLDETAEHALRTAGEHLAHIHIGNCAMDDPAHEAYGDSHPRFGAPGTRNGVQELTAFLRVLLDVGYTGPGNRMPVSFEVKPMKGEDPEAVIAGSKRALLEAWRRL